MSSSFKKRIIRELVVKGHYASGVKTLGEKKFKMFLRVWLEEIGGRAKDYPKDTVSSLIKNTWTNNSWMYSIQCKNKVITENMVEISKGLNKQ